MAKCSEKDKHRLGQNPVYLVYISQFAHTVTYMDISTSSCSLQYQLSFKARMVSVGWVGSEWLDSECKKGTYLDISPVDPLWYIWCISVSNFGRDITKYTIIHGAYIYTVVANPRTACNAHKSSHGRLEAFVIQTKLKLNKNSVQCPQVPYTHSPWVQDSFISLSPQVFSRKPSEHHCFLVFLSTIIPLIPSLIFSLLARQVSSAHCLDVTAFSFFILL